MDLRKVKKLIELAEEAGLAELEVTSGDESVRIAMAVANPVVATRNAASMPRAEAPSKSASSTNSATVVPTPMAGTFYQAPNPEAAPFVQIGDVVQPGDVLCIVESMKMMHEIKATTGGTVNAILVANGQPISTGDALFELS
ncbi:MAG: acetyl-CoA carboxylase biotin carboxyl carrier protein [Proteobacteria bacterium]|nr:acetyl-CoA carboxylase biotin carboxyl carrier protein [Pseudomonadota bacterium]